VTSADCLGGSFCKSGACVPAQGSGERCAAATECTSGFCTDGVCCEVSGCGSGSACAALPSAQAGKCLKRNGVTCGGPGECASGHCVDGVCCDVACGGQCEACNVGGSEGTCTPVVGDPKGTTRAACDAKADDACDKRQCDGTARDKCNGWKNGATTACGGDACLADKRLQRHGSCDGLGGCRYPDPTSCSPFACDVTAATGCKSTCASEADCADGFGCDGGKCVQGAKCSDDRLSSVDKTGVMTSCAPYRCGPDGKCLTQCGTSDDCTPGTSCDDTVRACVVLKAGETTSSGGCDVSTGSGGARDALAAAGALALLGLARRRRDRRLAR
jgi:MYXO-CTERM domain-containing protein